MGSEYDSNPNLAPKNLSEDNDARFVIRGQASYQLLDQSGFLVTTGFDGYLGVHTDVREVDLQTHSAYLRSAWENDVIRLDLRYDFAYTWLDLSEKFRELHRVTGSLTAREGKWGLFQYFAQFNHADFKSRGPRPAFNRDGPRYTTGVNQWIYAPERLRPLSFVRFGSSGDFYDADGGDFSYNAAEVSGGLGVLLPWEVTGSILYRYVWRYYREPQAAALLPGLERTDRIQFLAVDVTKNITDHWVASLGTTITLNASSIAAFDYDRIVAGAYLTYNF